MTKDVISLSISVLLLFRHYMSHKITFGAPSSGGVLCSACGAFISKICRPLVAKWRGEGKLVTMFLDDGFGCAQDFDKKENLSQKKKKTIF